MATKKYFKLVDKSTDKDKIIKVSVSFSALIDHVMIKGINRYEINEINYQTYRYLKGALK